MRGALTLAASTALAFAAWCGAPSDIADADARAPRPLLGAAATGGAPARIQLAPSRTAGDPRTIRSLLDIQQPMRFGEFFWNEAGVAPGPLWLRVDLERQVISVFRGGDEIATALIIYGAVNHPTPIGRFAVLSKQRNYRSITYDAMMPYALFLTRDGVAIHAADVQRRYASHGCIGVPTEFARRLFAAVRTGDPVDVIAA